MMTKDFSITTITSRIAKLNPNFLAIVLICIFSFIWAFLEVLVQHIPGGYSIYQIIWMRYATHWVFMLLVFGPRYGKKLIITKRLGVQLIRSVMMLIMPVSYVLATNYASVQNILSIFWLVPLMVIVSAYLLLGERVSWVYWASGAFASLFLALLLHPDRHITFVGFLLAFIMALSFSLYVVMTGMLREEFRLTNLFYTAIGVIIPLSLGFTSFWKPLTPIAGGLMVLIGLLGFVVLWMLDKALEHTNVSVLAPFLATEMIWILVIHFLGRIF
jgi:drug/metabolite transporter (DMT)-like permease